MQYLGSRVPLNVPHFRDFAATVKFYTHPNDVLGIFSHHNNNSDLCHFLGQAKWHVTGLGSQTSCYLLVMHLLNSRHTVFRVVALVN